MGLLVQRFGASVRGLRNADSGGPNQDAWASGSGRSGEHVVVCDGLGSRRSSDIGARAACLAVRRAVREWPGTDRGVGATHLVRLVEVLWRLLVAPHSPAECATTCAFVIREPSGALVLAGLGDALVLLRRADGETLRFGGRPAGAFGYETLALGTSHRLDDWWTGVVPSGIGRTVILATDGVSDDLAEDRYPAFAAWVANDIGALPPLARRRRLARELRDWPVPRHSADKTLAVLLESEELHS